MTPTTIVLIAVVWAVVGLAVTVWRLRQDVAAWDDDLENESDLRRSLNRRHVELTARVGVLEDSRSRTADLDLPDVDEPLDGHLMPDLPEPLTDAKGYPYWQIGPYTRVWTAKTPHGPNHICVGDPYDIECIAMFTNLDQAERSALAILRAVQIERDRQDQSNDQ